MRTIMARRGGWLSWVNGLRLVVLLGLIGGLIAGLVLQDQVGLTDLRDGFAAAGIWAPLLFVIAYVIATIVSLPGPLLTMTGGMLFGAWWATGYSLLGALIGGVLAFLISRYLARHWFERCLGPRLRSVKRGVDDEGWRFVLLARLLPVVPYSVLNYGFGLTRIRLLPYTVASLIGMAPATFVYSYLGELGGRILEREYTAVQGVLVAIALVAALVFLPRFIRRVRLYLRYSRDG